MESKVKPELYNESVSGKNFPKIMINEKKKYLASGIEVYRYIIRKEKCLFNAARMVWSSLKGGKDRYLTVNTLL